MSDRVALADVIVGERARKDFGDLSDLVESIRKHGVLMPIAVFPDNRLLCGRRRLEASRLLGLPTIPFHVTETREDALSRLEAERDENTCRKDMTPEEKVDLGMQIEELERPKAEERMAEGGRRGAESRWAADGVGPSGPTPSKNSATNRTAQVVGEALGLSKNTYKRAKRVVQTARGDNDPSPEVQATAQKALADMNAGTATIGGAYDRVQKSRATTEPELSEPPKRTPKCRVTKRKPLDILNKSVTSLQGITVALDGITELTVNPDEASRLTADLADSIRAITRVKKLLRTECTQ